ncbi:hypothetical protein CROQUDRAFT_99088 [Cronartium quercuum f. sp. fusiforme G11]|uniref:Nucleolar 27S pre-rRNA processing Urb2/Npa2 C-terminal domain-containing protein n=1 Tax=Cronartium quercuum f. sp. fusiforme G11 TaxID=708437 RepID=A0A9P6NCE8_9BASI|nr:hypothetical protein CROQUDRAFT_99088 [Cronartium quercuum f. sp. fusiforme G11]
MNRCSHAPNELFALLRSSSIPASEKIASARVALADDSWTLPHKKTYLLQWLLEYDSQRANQASKACLIDQVEFWSLLQQILSEMDSKNIRDGIPGSTIQSFVQKASKMWPSLLKDSTIGKKACSSFAKLFQIISHRVTFEFMIDLLQCTLEGLCSLKGSILIEAQNITLLIIEDAIQIIRQTSNYRKGALLLHEDRFFTPLLRSLSQFGPSSSIGQTLARLITDCIFSVDHLKRLLFNNTPNGTRQVFEWLSVLRPVIAKDLQLTASVIELPPFLLKGLIKDQSVLQAHVFASNKTLSFASGSQNSVTAVNIQSLQDLTFYFLSSSVQLLRDLPTDFGLATVELAMKSIGDMVTQIFTANIYSLAERFHYDVLDQIAQVCVEHLTQSSEIATTSFETLSTILLIDCRIIEGCLPQILQFITTVTSDKVTLASKITLFLGSMIDWFSKAKRLPQLLSLLHAAVEWKLSRSVLETMISGPLISLDITRKLRRELQLSASSMQLTSAHETAGQQLIDSLRSILPRGLTATDDEPTPKKLKKFFGNPQSPTSMPAKGSPATKSLVSQTEVARLLYNSYFYIIVATAALRSSLHGQDQKQFNASIDSNLHELENLLSSLCSDSQSVKQAKRQRPSSVFWDSPNIQTIAGSVFEVINTLSEVRSMQPNSRYIDLTKWHKVLRWAVSGKIELAPALTVQIVRCSLLQISTSVTFVGLPGQSAPLVYDLILKILDGSSNSDVDHEWDGTFHSLTSAQLPCVTWYILNTTHLSNFSDHATPEQLGKLSTIILRCSPNRCIPFLEGQSNVNPNDTFVTFRKVNATLLNSPYLHELTRVCKSLLEIGLKTLDKMILSRLSDTNPPCQILESHLSDSISLFANLVRLPPDCISKVTRIALLQRCLDLTLDLFSLYTASATTSKEALTQSVMTIAIIYSTRYCLSLIDVIETTADQVLLSKLFSLVTAFLSHVTDWQSCSESDILYELAEVFVHQSITFAFRCTGGLILSPNEDQARLKALIKTGMARVAHLKSREGLQCDKLIISAFKSVVESIQHCAEKVSLANRSVHQEWTQYVTELINHTLQAVESIEAGHFPLNDLQLELYKSHFLLARIADSIGAEVPLYTFPLEKVIAACSDLNDNSERSLKASSLSPRSSSNERLALKVIEEMINMHRSSLSKSLTGDRTPLVKSFQRLTILYVSNLVQIPAEVCQVQELKKQYHEACQVVSIEEYQATLDMLLEDYDQTLSSVDEKSLDQHGHNQLVKKLRALIETALIMLLNGPERVGKTCQSYISAFIRRFQHPSFYSLQTSETLLWQCQFLESICTAKINLIGRLDVALILEIVLQTLSHEPPNESLISKMGIHSNRMTCRSLYRSLVIIVSQVSRHRREHVLPVFHLLMAVLIALLYPLCRPTYLLDGPPNGKKKVPSKMIRHAQRRFPAWSWFDSMSLDEWEKVGCGASELAAYCRLLVSLGVKTTLVGRKIVKNDDGVSSYPSQDQEKKLLRPVVMSLIPALSKHAPFYLKQYVKLCTNVNVRLSNEFHLELLSSGGISVLIGSMGKYERGSIGKMLSSSVPSTTHYLFNRFHLISGKMIEKEEEEEEEEEDQEVQRAFWRKTLKVWEIGRYKGVD